jgi:exodeoxyribonuclease VIII
MTWDDYVKLAGLNWSTLKHMAVSPLHFQHACTFKRKDSDALALGRATHCAILEPERFAAEVVVFDGTRRGKEWDAFKAENARRTILKPDDFDYCIGMRDAVRANPQAMAYLERGRAEVPIEWVDKETGQRCKSRLDWVSTSSPAIVDLKTARSIDSRAFGAQAARLMYHGQLAFYSRGWSEVTGEIPPVVIIAVESEPPFDVGVFTLDPEEALYAGWKLCRDLIDRVAECKSVNCWPGRYSRETELDLPSWAFDEEDRGELTATVTEG